MAKTSFLIGSGFSRPAGKPGVFDITDRIRSGEGVTRHTDGCYYLSAGLEPKGSSQNYVESVVELINRIYPVIEKFFSGTRNPNYEDLYFSISQLRDNAHREYENPAIEPFSDQVRSEVADLLKRKRGLSEETWTFEDLLTEACNYVKDVVSRSLSAEPETTDYLKIIGEAVNDLSRITISTLNHDVLLEDYFQSKEITFTDGFGQPTNEVKYWSPSEFGRSDVQVELLKLHGSINWYRLRPDEGTWYDERYGIPLTKDVWHTRDIDGNLRLPVDGRPEFLAGTFNKILQYTDEIYVDLHCRFVNTLRSSCRLVVCGYGFSDKAVNSQLIRWLYEDPARKCVVIDPNPDAIQEYARGAIARRWDEWCRTEKVRMLRKSVSDVSWTEVSACLA